MRSATLRFHHSVGPPEVQIQRRNEVFFNNLVGGFNPFEKYINISQIGLFPQVGGK